MGAYPGTVRRPAPQRLPQQDLKQGPSADQNQVLRTVHLRAITASPSPDRTVKRRLEYIAWAREAISGLRGANEWLEAEFDTAAEAADASVRP